MKSYLIIFCILFLSVSNCYAQEVTISDTTKLIEQFCEMAKKDQSNMGNLRVRDSLFVVNFKELINITELYGFPKYLVWGRNKEERICIHSATLLTLIHISQSKPLLFTDKKIVTLFLNEINQGRLERSFLEEAFSSWYSGFTKPCFDDKEKIEFTLKTWGLKPIDEKNFEKCHQ